MFAILEQISMKRLLRILFSLIALKTQRVSSSYILLHTLSHAILKDSIRTGLLVSPRVCSRGRRGGGKKGGRKLSKDLLAKSGGPLRPRALEDADWARNRIRSCAALRGAPPSSFLPSLSLSLSLPVFFPFGSFLSPPSPAWNVHRRRQTSHVLSPFPSLPWPCN